MSIGRVLEEVGQAEARLARELLVVGERHRTDHDVFHVTRTLAKNEQGNLEALTRHADRYDASLPEAEEVQAGESKLSSVLEKGAELVRRRPEPSLLLIDDLRTLHLLASEASINWVILAQGTLAVKDGDLAATVSNCHDETLRTLKWTTYRIKTASPQALAAR